MKKIVLFIFIISLQSCTVPYDAETRLLFETQMVDSNENPIPNATLAIQVSNGSGFGSSSEIINSGTTNENGTIRLGFPSPIFDKGYEIQISSSNNDNSGFVPFSINNLLLDDFADFKLTIPKIYRLTVDEGVAINYSFFTSNPNRKITSFAVVGIYTPSFSNYSENDETSYFVDFYAKKNQVIQIQYQYEDKITGVIETVNQELTVIEESLSININY